VTGLAFQPPSESETLLVEGGAVGIIPRPYY